MTRKRKRGGQRPKKVNARANRKRTRRRKQVQPINDPVILEDPVANVVNYVDQFGSVSQHDIAKPVYVGTTVEVRQRFPV